MGKKKRSKSIVISGSGGSRPRSPREASETGFSNSKAQLVEVISEGMIEGIIGGAQGIYLDKTQVQNRNGIFNFSGFRYIERRGGANQTRVPDFSDRIQNERSVNTEVKNSPSITRSIVNDNLDFIRVRLGVQLQEYKDNGDVEGSALEFRILIREGTGGFVERLRRVVRGRYSSIAEFEYQFPVNPNFTNYSVRVAKLTPDSSNQKVIQKLYFQAFSEITNARLSYANTAIVALEFNAEQFSSVPNRAYKVGGIRVRIPSNATVRADRSLSFTGSWDGTFTLSSVAINDPVWQLYQVLTNKRWGLGRYIDESAIDKWSLYQCSVYNNELISNGLGGTEPRYQCSTVIQGKQKVWDVITALCSSCNMKPYWSEGKISFWQDRPSPVVYQFTQADVASGDFIYSSTALRSRYTLAMVSWNDPNDFYQQAIEPVEDPEGISKYGIRELEIAAYGCVSVSQTIRMGKWALFSSRMETETVNFTARSYAAFVRPGDVIQIADERRANARYGGLIKNIFNDRIVLDFPVVIDAGMTITMMNKSGSLETRTINNTIGSNTDTLFFTTPIVASNFNIESNWLIQSNALKPQLFRVLSVTPKQDPTQIDIVAIQHIPEKYDAIERGLTIPSRNTRIDPPDVISQPRNLLANLIQRSVGSFTSYSLLVDWDAPISDDGFTDPFISSYVVEYKLGLNGVWQGNVNVTTTSQSYDNLPLGEYYVRVASVNTNGIASEWLESSLVLIFDPENPPPGNLPLTSTNIKVNTSGTLTAFNVTPPLQGSTNILLQSEAELDEPIELMGVTDFYPRPSAEINNALYHVVTINLDPSAQLTGTVQLSNYTITQSSIFNNSATFEGTLAKLTDQATNTGAATGNTTSIQWIKASFPSPVTIAGVTVGGGSITGLTDFATSLNNRLLQYSSDDINWTTLLTITGVTNTGTTSQREFSNFAPVTARYWRIATSTIARVATTEFRFRGVV